MDQSKCSKDNPFPLMIDCYMSLTVPYTVSLIDKIEKEIKNNPKYSHCNVKWVEEHLPPDDYDGNLFFFSVFFETQTHTIFFIFLRLFQTVCFLFFFFLRKFNKLPQMSHAFDYNLIMSHSQ